MSPKQSLGKRMIRHCLFAVALLLAMPATTLAVLPPDVYREARRTADHHVQTEVTGVKAPAKTPGDCIIEGRVATVFRGDLAKGTPVSYPVACLRTGDMPPVGGTLWGNADELTSARFMEVYLNGQAPRLSVARWQYRIISGPTKAPVCPVDKPGLTCW